MATTKKPKLSKDEALANLIRYRSDFNLFVKEVLGATPFPYQEEILRTLSDPDVKRVAWHKGHGVGGTTLMSWITIAFLFTRSNAKVVTTASVNRQVRDILWPEIHRWMRKADFGLMGWYWPYNLLDQKMEISQEWFAIGASSDTPENMEGFHAPHLLYIVDEAKTVPKGIFEAIEGALTGNIEAKLMVVSTPPLAREGHFYDICRGAVPGFKVFHTRCQDSPNVSREWIEEKRLEWGETSPVYISKVLGEFPDASEDTLIPLSWVELAMERWLENVNKTDSVVMGADIARYGNDSTILAIRNGNWFEDLVERTKQDTMATAGLILNLATRKKIVDVRVDTIGVGAGVVDRLREQSKETGVRVRPINVANKAPSMMYKGERIKFHRMRDWLYWNMRTHLDPNNPDQSDLVSLPKDDKLKSQLTSIRYKIRSDGAIEIESKDSMKARGLSSPDRAEAVMIALADGYEGWSAVVT